MRCVELCRPGWTSLGVGSLYRIACPFLWFGSIDRPISPCNRLAYGASCGHVSSKKITILDFKQHMPITTGSLILDFGLVSASAGDLVSGRELLQKDVATVSSSVTGPVFMHRSQICSGATIASVCSPSRATSIETGLCFRPSTRQLCPLRACLRIK